MKYFLRLVLVDNIIQYIPTDTPTPNQILYNKKYAKYFKDYIRAIDSTKILISPLIIERVAFRDSYNNLT
jgi:hypothetical protein